MVLEFIDQRPESVARTLMTMRGDFLDRGRIRRPPANILDEAIAKMVK
jgi:hypothetical protein